MSRITKQLAEEIANKLVEKLDVKLKTIDDQLAEIYYEEQIKIVPLSVMTIFESHPDYIHKTTSGYLYYGGQCVWIKGVKPFPCITKSNVTDKDICSKIEKLVSNQISTKKERKELFEELQQTLLKLTTFNKIREYFPEASGFLPEPKMEIAINITDTRNRLNSI